MTQSERVVYRLNRSFDLFTSGLLSVSEVVSGVLYDLSDMPDGLTCWDEIDPRLRRVVLEHLVAVGPDGLPPVFLFGTYSPEWAAAEAVRQRALAARIMAARSDPLGS